MGPCLDWYFSSLNFRYSLLITLKCYTHLVPSLNIFHIICRPYSCHLVLLSFSFFLFLFFFFFFSVPRSPEPSERIREKKKKSKNTRRHLRSPNPGEEGKKEEEGRHRDHRTQEKKEKRKKKGKIGQKLRLSYDQWVHHVCLITKMSLSYELWKLKTTKMCFQFP